MERERNISKTVISIREPILMVSLKAMVNIFGVMGHILKVFNVFYKKY
jgi:hypothetical protein